VPSAGFDCGSYPGDAAITTWAAASPYAFVGYYLDAPCHSTKSFTSWSGKFPLIQSLGLGLAVIYVGLQQQGCGSTKLSRARGVTDGRDTVAKCTAEGLPEGTIVFLDIESFDGALFAPMQAYMRGWMAALLDSGFARPGIYCPAARASQILAVAKLEYAEHGVPDEAPAFWIVKVTSAFDPASSAPADCGVAFASVWQGRLDIAGETHGGVSIDIDQNVADSADPSGGREIDTLRASRSPVKSVRSAPAIPRAGGSARSPHRRIGSPRRRARA
jgi:hypothetical protein